MVRRAGAVETEQVCPEYRWAFWFLARVLDILQCTVPRFFESQFRRHLSDHESVYGPV